MAVGYGGHKCFSIKMIVKICEIAQFTRATPGSSLVLAIEFVWF